MQGLKHRKAIEDDIETIVNLLLEDDLGKTREQKTHFLDQRYIEAFHKIDIDPNQYLMVVMQGDEIVGTCHLTIMPSLTFKGSTRMQIEAVRVKEKYRGQKIGAWMFDTAIEYAKERGATIVQLTTNKERPDALRFYKQRGFVDSHIGMKLYLD